MLLLLAMACSAGAEQRFSGPLELRDALTYYIVNESGEDFTVSLHHYDPWQAETDRPVLARVYDPQERLLLQRLHEGRRETPAPQTTITLPSKGAGAGVYQVALTGIQGSTIEIAIDPPLPWGVFGYPTLSAAAEQFAPAYFFIPPGADSLALRCEGAMDRLIVRDLVGEARLELRGTNAGGAVTIADHAGEVWSIVVEGPRDFRMNFGVVPVILCPDEATARAIHGSIDVLADGTICFHKFQARAHELLQRYRAMPGAGFRVDAPVLSRYAARWAEDPVRNRLLLGAYGVYAALPALLREQNLVAGSPWFGCIGAWHAPGRRGAAERPENPWQRLDRLQLDQVAEHVNSLAAVYSIDAPFNPLQRDDRLRNRIIIGALQELMLLREHELPHPEFTTYAGGERAFRFARFTFAFPLVAPDCPDDVRAVWTEGLHRAAARQAITQVASTVNQWSFTVRGLHQFAQGVNEPWADELVQMHLRWILQRVFWGLGFAKAGYFAESEGPDCTYNGITTHNLACILEERPSDELRDAIQASFNLFNHTIAQEPDGSWIGSTSFNHRTPWDFTRMQWGGGVGMLADDFPEAAVHVGEAWLATPLPRGAPEFRAAELALRNQLEYLDRDALTDKNIGGVVIADGPMIFFQVWKHFASPQLQGSLPMVSEANFTRNFGDEFLCVRRPGYYAFLYAGTPMKEWQKERRPRDLHSQFPHNAGGLCMFWSPAMGVSLLGQNWSPFAAHSIIVERARDRGPGGDAQVSGGDWEDYWSVERQFDADAATAVITGRMRDQPIAFERRWRFLDDRVQCALNIRSDGAASVDSMWECFPFRLIKTPQLDVALLDEAGRPVPSGHSAAAILFSAGGREAHLIVFEQPRICEIGRERCTDAYGGEHEYGRVLAALPDLRQTGGAAAAEVRWTMLPVPAQRIAETVAATVNALRQADHPAEAQPP